MYRAFNLSKCDWSEVSSESGRESFDRNSETIRESLESFLTDGIIDGTKLRDDWFPAIECDVFISHSHDDLEDAIKCASWLKDNLGINAFIDSCVWGHAKELQKEIDDKYCSNADRETYSYSKIMRSTSHVHMMLVSALNEMVDTAECIIFINTPNSISSAKNAISKTQSPWIFYELATMRTIRRKKPKRLLLEEHNFSQEGYKSASLKVDYVVPLHEMTSIEAAHLMKWLEDCEEEQLEGALALDLLYKTYPTPP